MSSPTPNPPVGSETPSAETRWSAAVARVRDTNAWIIKAFVGLTGVLVGSGPLLVKLGDLPSTPRVALAAVTAFAALIGVGIVIHHASTVMLPETADLPDLVTATHGPLARFRAHIEEHPQAYLGDAATVAELVDRSQSWRRTVIELAEREATSASLDADQRAALAAALPAARGQLGALRATFDDLLDQAVYTEVRGTFERAWPKMFAGAALAAVGTTVYLGALSIDIGTDDASAAKESAKGAAMGMFQWASDRDRPDVDTVRTALGLQDDTCSTLPVVFTGTGAGTDPWKVTTLDGGSCRAAPVTFTVDQRYGIATSRTPRTYELEGGVARHTDGTMVAAVGVAGLLVGAVAASAHFATKD